MLQTLLRERRTIKNEREIIQKILDYGINKNNVENLYQDILGSKNKVYIPRVLPELFSGDNIMDISV